MKFSVNTIALKNELAKICGVVPNNNTIPIINCVFMKLDGDVLTLRATDMSTTISATMKVFDTSADKMSCTAIPATLLQNIVKTLDNGVITIEVSEKDFSAVITSADGKYRLSGRNADLYPKVPEVEYSTTVMTKVGTLLSGIGNTLFAADSEASGRPQLCSILARLEEDGFTFAATNAHILSRYINRESKPTDTCECMLPATVMPTLKKVLATAKDDDPLQMSVNETNAEFRFDNVIATIRLVDGKYPNINAVIKTEGTVPVIVSKDELVKKLKRVSLFANQNTMSVKLQIEKQTLTIIAEDIEFSNDANDKLPCSYEGDPMTIGVNATLLMKALSPIDSENVYLLVSNPLKPVYFMPEKNEIDNIDILTLVMPVSLS